MVCWVCRAVCRLSAADDDDVMLLGFMRLSAGSGASTYPANRDFKGHVGGVRGAAPQGFFLFFSIFFEFFCQIFKEKKGDVLTNI